ncbi:winged helix-turn-helix domain-containing protein [Halorussus halophilus]|uniref:winged helix-turn-helix domain-containing protein n=1 Tax=Halorussus halophilus TaxID=2650975 RepID=UPI001CE49997|nr:winged helix-turn-helix domain-containing protein [Halorussus halophilus]
MSDENEREDNPEEFTDEENASGATEADDASDEIPVDTDGIEEGSAEGEDAQKRLSKGRDRLEEEADKAVGQFDQGIVDLLSWVLDTETRARIFVYLRQHPYSTSEEIAEGTGLYPSTVRESLAELHTEEKVVRRKRESEGAGNNPYEYTAIAPSELVGGIVGQIQDELNTVFNLDDHLERGDADTETEPSRPVSIQVEESDSDELESDDESADTETVDDTSDDSDES